MAHYVAFVPIITILVCLGFPFTSGYHQPSRTHTRTHYTRLTHRERTSVKYSDQSRCVGHSTFFRDGKHISGLPMPSWVRSWLAANTTATAGTHKTWKRKIQKRKCRSAVPRVCVTFAWPIHNNKLIFYIFDARNPHLRLTVDHRPISCVKRPWQHSLNACERTSEQARTLQTRIQRMIQREENYWNRHYCASNTWGNYALVSQMQCAVDRCECVCCVRVRDGCTVIASFAIIFHKHSEVLSFSLSPSLPRCQTSATGQPSNAFAWLLVTLWRCVHGACIANGRTRAISGPTWVHYRQNFLE